MLFLNPVLPSLDKQFFKMLNKYSVRIGLLFIDSVSCLPKSYFTNENSLIECFPKDKIFTYDPEDARNNNWQVSYNYYSKLSMASNNIDYDACLVLYNKGRAIKAVEVYDVLTKMGCNCCFYISGVDDAFISRNKRSGIIYNHLLEYPEILNLIGKSRVIIELCQNGQTGNTLRTFEAVVYDKKLITDNHNIAFFPYYNEKYMKVINNASDFKKISIDFLKTNYINPSYDIFEGEFSPVHLLDLL